jgi:hypothetical protein
VAELRTARAEVLRKADVEKADLLPEGVRVLPQKLMELKTPEYVRAEPHERTLKGTGLSQRLPRAAVRSGLTGMLPGGAA